MRWFTWVWCNYPLGADTQRLHQAGVSLSEQGGGGGGARGAGGELSSGGRRGDGQGHGAGLLLHPLDATQSHMSACYISVVSQKRLCSLLFSFATHLLTPKYCGLWFLLFITNYFINFWVFCTHWELLVCVCAGRTYCAMFQAFQEAVTEVVLLSTKTEAECQTCEKPGWNFRHPMCSPIWIISRVLRAW